MTWWGISRGSLIVRMLSRCCESVNSLQDTSDLAMSCIRCKWRKRRVRAVFFFFFFGWGGCSKNTTRMITQPFSLGKPLPTKNQHRSLDSSDLFSSADIGTAPRRPFEADLEACRACLHTEYISVCLILDDATNMSPPLLSYITCIAQEFIAGAAPSTIPQLTIGID